MKKIIVLSLILISAKSYAQSKNYIDLPYIETIGKVDSLVVPDKIYLNIIISEKDTKGKISVEEQETKMYEKLKSIGIATEKQISLNDMSSFYNKYFLKQDDIQKNKIYSLLVYNGTTVGKVILGLEEIGISNVKIEKAEFSKAEDLILILKSKAILKAKNQAIVMTEPLHQKVGNAIYISDFNTTSDNLGSRYGGVIIRGLATSNGKNNFNANDIEFEKLKIGTEVKVIFKLE
jgi:uncharacterized protein YggE